MKMLTLLSIAVLTAMFITSCNKEEVGTDKSRIEIVVRAKTPVLKNAATQPMVIETFKINIDEIEFELADEWEDMVPDGIVKLHELDGPFLIDLVSPNAITGLSLGNVLVPRAQYEVVEFDLDSTKVTTIPEMLHRSIFVSGTLNGIPFQFWTNYDASFEIYLQDQNRLNLTGAEAIVFIEFNMGLIFQSFISRGLANAVDGNRNGIIEIGHNDTDGNRRFVEGMIDAIVESVEVDDDDDDDDDDDG